MTAQNITSNANTSTHLATPITVHPAFELLRQQYIPALSTTVFEFRHKVTHAVHYHLANDNDENVFLVAFRTQPMSSKGEAHILEHTVLCGSQKYPVRDPFFSMIKRSLNTFMNAFTAADWTAYPFATQNKKDFDNLLSVYLDAAFFANINELDFMQEGIRVELIDHQPVFKGIVFNEMKGASSSPDDQLYHCLSHHLFPTSTYHYNSGGDPAHIPDLTYEELKAFYHSHYHPSNAVFMTFGDNDIYQLHDKIEQQALKHFQRGQTLYSTPEQRLTQPIVVNEYYTFDEADADNKTYHIIGWLLPQATDLNLRLAMRLVEGVLLADSASPLRHYLETCQLGISGPILGLGDSHAELTFYCGIQGSQAIHGENFEQGVFNILKEVASKPIAPAAIEAILHRIELSQRETSTGSTPYGLHLIFGGLYHAIHHGDPIKALDLETALKEIRQQLADDPMYLSDLIQTHLIDNPHRVRMVFSPDHTLTEKRQKAEQERLDEIAKHLTDAQRQEIIAKTQALQQRQETVDDFEILPKVGLADIPSELKRIDANQQTLHIAGKDYPLYLYETGTNGLYYQQVIFDIPQHLLHDHFLEYVDLLVGDLGAGDDDYLTLQQHQTAISGGVSTGNSIRSGISHTDRVSAMMKLQVKALNRNPTAIDLAHHVLVNMRFDEKQRILDLLKKRRNNWADHISHYGHAYAMEIASRGMSAYAQRENQLNGLTGLNWLTEQLQRIEHDEEAYAEFITQLKATHHALITAPRAYLLICEASQTDILKQHIIQAWQSTPSQQPFQHQEVTLPYDATDLQNQAWIIQTNVQFCAKSYPAVPVEHEDAAPLMVLAGYLRNGYLHRAIREQGGAYGGGAGYDGQSCSFRFYSYRDPRLSETLQDFDQSIHWLMNEPQQDYQLEEAILGLIASMDKPSSPANEAAASCLSDLHGRTHTFRTQLRQRILDVTLDDLKRVAEKYLVNRTSSTAVLAPIAKQDELVQLEFSIHKVL